MTSRTAELERSTNETTIRVAVNLDEETPTSISTGIGFLDHMLDALARHARFSIVLTCEGDLGIDDHHSAEDCAIVLGSAIDTALGDRSGIERFASAYAPMDEALARAAVDLSGRPSPNIGLGFTRETLGGIATENITHFFETLAVSLRASVHIDLIRGRNDHHKSEAAFKALALALRDATRITRPGAIPSTKGTLS